MNMGKPCKDLMLYCSTDRLYLLDMPSELVEEILSYMSFDEISHLRVVSRTFNRSCSMLLNRGFIRVEKFHSQCQKKVKAQLPRRESERRNHPLARHSDVLSAIETRLSLLGMTYMKYVDMNLCCFIPGKVIDEIYKVLRTIQTSANPPRVHELLQELRDISSMAMEYFEEKVAPTLKMKLTSPANFLAAAVGVNMSRHSQLMDFGSPVYRSLPSSSSSSSNLLTPARSALDPTREDDLAKMYQTVASGNTSKKEMAAIKNKQKDTERQVRELHQIVAELNSRIALLEYDRQHVAPGPIPALKSTKLAIDASKPSAVSKSRAAAVSKPRAAAVSKPRATAVSKPKTAAVSKPSATEESEPATIVRLTRSSAKRGASAINLVKVEPSVKKSKRI